MATKAERIALAIVIISLCALFVFGLSQSSFGDVSITGSLNVTGDLNMTDNNITNVDCVLFLSGGQICDSP